MSQAAAALLSWFQRNARRLPWRETRDPYAVWVAEVMLQQTRVETALPYYQRWMQHFPSLESLAGAPRQQVLRLWEGLGYYRRAHNLHLGAQIVHARYDGQVPASIEELRQLPGVGAYTAAAIAAMAFDQDVIALDGNLRRVLSRFFDLDLDPRSPEGESRLLELTHQMWPAGQAWAFNQALMDLGSLICTPRSPVCGSCPLERHCRANAGGVQELRPVRKTRPQTPLKSMVAAVVLEGGQVLIRRRAEGGLLGGLWGFPEGERLPGESPEAAVARLLKAEYGLRVTLGARLPALKHAYSHFRVRLVPVLCQAAGQGRRLAEGSALRWTAIEQLGQLPMGKLDRQIAGALPTHPSVAPGPASA